MSRSMPGVQTVPLEPHLALRHLSALRGTYLSQQILRTVFKNNNGTNLLLSRILEINEFKYCLLKFSYFTITMLKDVSKMLISIVINIMRLSFIWNV